MSIEEAKKNYTNLLKRCCTDNHPTIKELDDAYFQLRDLTTVLHGGKYWRITKRHEDGSVDITSPNNTSVYRYKIDNKNSN